jgi:hypothetical protein
MTIPYHSLPESTDWLNFIHGILTNFAGDHILAAIDDLVSSKMRLHSFALRSLGNSLTIPCLSALTDGTNDI